MKKLLLIFGFSLAMAPAIYAQSGQADASASKGGVKFTVSADGGIPLGDASNAYDYILGGSVKLEVPTTNTTYFTVEGGYQSFFVNSALKDLGVSSTSNFVPVKGGIKGYVSNNFFLEAQAGIVWNVDSGGGGNSFVASGGLGYSFKGGFEAGLRYEDWTNTPAIGQLTLRIAWRF